MIIDVFMFNDELDMLRCRIAELSPMVDEFVAVSGTHTLAGDLKPDRLSGFEHPQLTKLRVDNFDTHDVEVGGGWVDEGNRVNWERDKKQRQGVEPYLLGKHPDDTIIFSDADEIPRREAIKSFDADGPRCLRMRHFIYSLAWETNDGWPGSVITKHSHGYDWGDFHSRRELPGIQRGGWHLGWFGGEAAIKKKVSEYAHPELRDLVVPRFKQHTRPADGIPLTRYMSEDKPRWAKAGLAPASWYIA